MHDPDLTTVLSEPPEIKNLAQFIANGRERRSFCLGFDDWNRGAWGQRDLGVSTGSAQFLAGETIPDVLAAVRPVSLIGQIPIQVLSGLTTAFRLPRVATGTTSGSAAENAAISESDPTFGSAGGLRPLRISTVVKYSRQVLAQAGGQGFNRIIQTDIARGLAYQMDNQIINGAPGANPGQCQGILSQAGGSTVSSGFTFGGALAATTGSWMIWITAIKNMEAIGIQPSHWLIGTTTALKARTIQRGAGQAMFLLHPDATSDAGFATERIAKYPVIVTPYLTNTVENVLLGQWNLCYILVWGNGIEITVDPYSAAATGEVQITGTLLWNFCIRHPGAVAVSTDGGNQ